MLAAAGLTATDATGTLDTVTAAVPLCPSLVAVIVAAPTATPVTSPLADTVATALLLVVQVTVRPLSRLPLASLSVAVSCTVPPRYMLGAAGLTVTDATGTFATVTAALPLLPSLVAVIVTVPAATPVTRPLAETVASVGFELAHATDRPASTFPAASFGVALSCSVPPTRRFANAGLTTTEATGTLDTVTVPSSTPVPGPLAETVASGGLQLAHATDRPASTFPAASFGVALSCCVPPTSRFANAGLTTTEATGTLDTVTLAVPLCPSLV